MSRQKVSGSLGALTFVVTGALLLLVLGIGMGDLRFDQSRTYNAVFSTTSGLHAGDEVRAAGVSVGRVKEVELRDDARAVITFSASAAVPLTSATVATIRYKNLTGDMFLDLTNSDPDARVLAEGDELPLAQTKPALDLDQLFNGFKPLLAGLSPEGVNQLATSIIEVFEGQTTSVHTLLTNVATFTGTLADQDRVIGEVIANLDTVLGTLDERKAAVSSLVVNLRKVVTGLARDRKNIGGSLERLNRLASQGSEFLLVLRPELKGTVAEVRRVATALNSDLGAIDRTLGAMPEALRKTGRVGAYGSFYNLYLCGIAVTFTGPNGVPSQGPMFLDDADRCQKEGDQE